MADDDRITPEVLKEALQAFERTKDVTLLKHEVVAGVVAEKGEGWASDLFRINIKAKVKGKQKKYSWISKYPPKDATKV